MGSSGLKVASILILSCISFGSGQILFLENESPRDNYYDSFVDGGDTNPNGLLYANAIPLDSRYKENSISNGLNNFGLKLNKVLLGKSAEGSNIVLSPLSVAGALSLLLLGSVGSTYDELANALGFFHEYSNSRSVHSEFGSLLDKLTRKGIYETPYYNNNQPNISYGSAVFVQNDSPVREQYADFIRTIYKSLITHVDFRNNGQGALEIINGWVSNLTNGKIPNMLSSPPTAETRLIIASALYFKSEWEKYFLDGLTRRLPFTLDKRYPERTVMVDMMANEGPFPYYKSREHECVLVGLPYKGNNTVMYVIKPLDAMKKNLQQIINDMTAQSLDYLISNARVQATIVTFPKMKLTSSYSLKSILQDMGVRTVFSSSEANLALLSPISQGPSSAPMKQERYTTTESYDNEKFVFSRFGEDPPKEEKCSHLFMSNNSTNANCTVTEIVNGKPVQVVYKRLGDKIGRRIIKRSADDSARSDKDYVRHEHRRLRRQSPMDLWNPGLYVDDVIHKVDMDITETGTEAAAATMVLITKDGRRPVFTANEPFYFVIRDEETKFILFSGAIYRPIPHFV